MAKKNVPQEGPNVLKYGKRRTQEAERLVLYPINWTRSENAKPRKVDTKNARVYNIPCGTDTVREWKVASAAKGEN
jgi:hypothetical protein